MAFTTALELHPTYAQAALNLARASEEAKVAVLLAQEIVMDTNDVPDWIYEPLFSPDTEEHTVENQDPSLSHELEILEHWVNDVEAITKQDIGLYTQIMEPIQSRAGHREPLLDGEDLVRSLLVPSSNENVDHVVEEPDRKRVASQQSTALDRTKVGAVAETSTYLESIAPPSLQCMSFLASSADLRAASDKEEGKRRSPTATVRITSTSSATPTVATIEPVLQSAVFPVRLTPTTSANEWRHIVAENVPKDYDTEENDAVSAMVNTLVPRSRFKSQSCHIFSQNDETTVRVLREAPPLRRSMTDKAIMTSALLSPRLVNKKKAW